MKRHAAATTAVLALSAVLGLAGCSSGSSGTAATAGDGEMACALVRKLPEQLPEPSPSDAANSWDLATGRLNSALELARIAALQDKKYQPLADSLAKAREAYSTTFDIHRAEPAVKEARTHC